MFYLILTSLKYDNIGFSLPPVFNNTLLSLPWVTLLQSFFFWRLSQFHRVQRAREDCGKEPLHCPFSRSGRGSARPDKVIIWVQLSDSLTSVSDERRHLWRSRRGRGVLSWRRRSRGPQLRHVLKSLMGVITLILSQCQWQHFSTKDISCILQGNAAQHQWLTPSLFFSEWDWS